MQKMFLIRWPKLINKKNKKIQLQVINESKVKKSKTFFSKQTQNKNRYFHNIKENIKINLIIKFYNKKIIIF
jgi:hypothetical protein